MACVRVSKPPAQHLHANTHRPHPHCPCNHTPTLQHPQARNNQRTAAGPGSGCQLCRGCCHSAGCGPDPCGHGEQEQAWRVYGSASPQRSTCTPTLIAHTLIAHATTRQLYNIHKHATTNAQLLDLVQVVNCVGDAATQLVAFQIPVCVVHRAKHGMCTVSNTQDNTHSATPTMHATQQPTHNATSWFRLPIVSGMLPLSWLTSRSLFAWCTGPSMACARVSNNTQGNTPASNAHHPHTPNPRPHPRPRPHPHPHHRHTPATHEPTRQLYNTCKHATNNAQRLELGQVANRVGDAATQLVAGQKSVCMVNMHKHGVCTG